MASEVPSELERCARQVSIYYCGLHEVMRGVDAGRRQVWTLWALAPFYSEKHCVDRADRSMYLHHCIVDGLS